LRNPVAKADTHPFWPRSPIARDEFCYILTEIAHFSTWIIYWRSPNKPTEPTRRKANQTQAEKTQAERDPTWHKKGKEHWQTIRESRIEADTLMGLVVRRFFYMLIWGCVTFKGCVLVYFPPNKAVCGMWPSFFICLTAGF
jgi:hypothetical protein